MLNKKIRKLMTMVVAAAILWLFVGSLVNFHQHRIFGKQLIEETTPFVKPKDKQTILVQVKSAPETQEQKSYFQTFLFMAFMFSIAGFVISWRKTYYPAFTLALKISEFRNFREFRGPPSF